MSIVTKPGSPGFKLRDEVRRYEADLIREALIISDGKITKAAQLLGISHQSLSEIIKGRQRELLQWRAPMHPRRIPIIKNHDQKKRRFFRRESSTR